ncbi:uncharacterized protein KIAA2013 homolog [Uloborus diversus]|uniref:uncharacterized protein KIAA2013 homolog n=1 Tax=Uloborus diversus TaxID=327109 RepID=UPI002408FEDA|nr:uncharacterized protein KIAA2013 homolog [Uloborus diversus]XP_054722362.1 uncharacterized protein KIAA2013 homolog [Uloborus diversus]
MLLELCDWCRKCKRGADGYVSLRRVFLLVIVLLGFLLYAGPSMFRWLRKKTPIMIDPNIGCVAANMNSLVRESTYFDASIFRSYEPDDEFLLPFIGNGKMGVPLDEEEKLYLFYRRSLSVPVPYRPVVRVDIPGAPHREGFATQYKNGIAYKFQCFNMRRHPVSVIHQFYAYRVVPSIFIQQIEITNPLNEDLTLILRQESSVINDHTPLVITLPNGNRFEYGVFSDVVAIPGSSEKMVVSVATTKVLGTIVISPKSSKKLVIRTAVHYSEPSSVSESESVKQKLESRAQMDLRNALDSDPLYLRMKHIESWKKLWHSGFSISYSKAQGALNGDRINATLYYVLSSARDPPSESDATPGQRAAALRYLYMPDKCYSGHHTLQASTLWSDLKTMNDVNRIVDLWILTLTKQGCHHLLMAGAEGVMQAMLLSFGGFKFSQHHLEWDTEPKDLHRDLSFRRMVYGNATHVNVSVAVRQEDNKAVIWTALDRSDKDYYACDGGCLDPPIKLGSDPVQLPVKLTSPITAILYITADKQHMEELKHTIHVAEVVEAPAHEHHILAQHRHGHQLGGLPAFFWVSVAFLIAVFHLFLAKLVYNEYCSSQEKSRGRYVV